MWSGRSFGSILSKKASCFSFGLKKSVRDRDRVSCRCTTGFHIVLLYWHVFSRTKASFKPIACVALRNAKT
jgi:hypothetical protein